MTDAAAKALAYEVAHAALCSPQQVGILRLSDIDNLAVGQHHLEANQGIKAETALGGLEGVACIEAPSASELKVRDASAYRRRA